MNLTLLIVVILTAIALVGIALGVARIVSPRSYNRQKGEAYNAVFQPVAVRGCSSKPVIICLRSCS